MDEEIRNAIKLLRENGYIVKKFTKQMQADSLECEQMEESGEQKECWGCSCSMCVIQ